MLKSFTELTEIEKQKCFTFIKDQRKGSKQDYDEFIKYYGGEVFNRGNSCFVSINDENIEGIIGIVTKEVPIRKEAFIFNFYVRNNSEDSARKLLKRAIEVCAEAKSQIARLGIKLPDMEVLDSIVKEHGFRNCYDALNMKVKRNGQSSFSSPLEIEIVRISDDNKNEYIRIHNNAFRHAPNGGDITLEELEEMLKEYEDKPELVGLVKNKGTYAGIYELAIKEETGWINAVGIHKDYWGKGMGKELVSNCMDILFSNGVREIKLTVLSSNERAIHLYKKLGFAADEVISTWFIKVL